MGRKGPISGLPRKELTGKNRARKKKRAGRTKCIKTLPWLLRRWVRRSSIGKRAVDKKHRKGFHQKRRELREKQDPAVLSAEETDITAKRAQQVEAAEKEPQGGVLSIKNLPS